MVRIIGLARYSNDQVDGEDGICIGVWYSACVCYVLVSPRCLDSISPNPNLFGVAYLSFTHFQHYAQPPLVM